MRARSSACCTISWYHFIMIAARSLAVLLRQGPQALSAATMALWQSTGPKLATLARCRPVAGSVTSKRALPATHSPPIKASVFSRLGSFSAASGEVAVCIVVSFT